VDFCPRAGRFARERESQDTAISMDQEELVPSAFFRLFCCAVFSEKVQGRRGALIAEPSCPKGSLSADSISPSVASVLRIPFFFLRRTALLDVPKYHRAHDIALNQEGGFRHRPDAVDEKSMRGENGVRRIQIPSAASRDRNRPEGLLHALAEDALHILLSCRALLIQEPPDNSGGVQNP